jgi:hypothetical protein
MDYLEASQVRFHHIQYSLGCVGRPAINALMTAAQAAPRVLN